MANFSSMWIGSSLNLIAKISINSFIKNDHTFTLYLYDKNIEVPKGVIIKDANEIIPSEEIFSKNNIYQPFADLFRYKMMMEFDDIWVDLDTICLRKDWDFEEYIFGSEGKSYDPNKDEGPNNAIIRFPKNGEFLKYVYETAKSIDIESLNWYQEIGVPIELGPMLIDKATDKFNIKDKMLPMETFYAVHHEQVAMFADPNQYENVCEIVKNSHAAHVYNSLQKPSDRENFAEGSFLWHMMKKYGAE
jgi:hypothetical protein